jgi:hypothetical protein
MKIYNLILMAISLGMLVSACKTDDVKPKVIPNTGSLVTMAIDNSNIIESGGVAQITVTLSQITNIDVEVKLGYTGLAIINKDYSSNLSITIPAGNMSNSTSLLALQDTLKEGTENINIAIDSIINGIEDGTQLIALTIEDDDVPATANIILNEILYDPSNTALDGDANGDGVYAQAADEFIELINNSNSPIDLSGFKVFDAAGLTSGTPNHTIPNGTTLQPKKALVIFGGGTPTGTFGGALVQKSTSGDLNLNNAGDILTIQDSSGNVVISYDITPLSDNPNESYTRSPDIIGNFEQHSKVTTTKFSPGTKSDATASPF